MPFNNSGDYIPSWFEGYVGGMRVKVKNEVTFYIRKIPSGDLLMMRDENGVVHPFGFLDVVNIRKFYRDEVI